MAAAASAAARETPLASPPADSVSALRFSPIDAPVLLAASWDCGVRLYDTAANRLLAHGTAHRGPVLDAVFGQGGDARAVFSGGLDRDVRVSDDPGLKTHNSRVLGAHDDAVRCMEYAPAHGVLLTGSWDCSVKAWDTREGASTGGVGRPVASLTVPDRVYSMSLAGPDSLLVATAGRHVLALDLRKVGGEGSGGHGALRLSSARESSLKHQTRVVRAFNDGSGFATGSIEGRVAIDFLEGAGAAAAATGKYAFKCHRVKAPDGGERVFPVHAIAVHPGFGTFATGGGDGVVSMWDWVGKKRLAQFTSYPAPITALAFNKDGTALAVGTSDDYAGGEPGAAPPPAPAIFVRTVADGDVRPKAAAAKA